MDNYDIKSFHIYTKNTVAEQVQEKTVQHF